MERPIERSHRLQSALWLLLVNGTLVATYFVAGQLSLQLARTHANASAVWPPTGIALAALLLFGYRSSLGVFVGAFLVNVTGGVTVGDVPTSLGIATGNTLEALLGAWLCLRFADGIKAFAHPRSFILFVVLSGVLSTMVSATIGVTSLELGHHALWGRFWAIWYTWWLGDSVGALVVAPFLILWATNPAEHRDWRRFAEVAGLIVAVLVLSWAVFNGWLPEGRDLPVGFICLPILIVCAFRFQLRETIAVIVLTSLVAISGTWAGRGPFATETPEKALLLLQLFIACSTVTIMTLAATISDRRRTDQELQQAHRDLELRVKQRTSELAAMNETLRQEILERRAAENRFRGFLESAPDAIVIVNNEGTIVLVNAQTEMLFGYPRAAILGQPVEMLIPERFRAQHRQHRERFFEHTAFRPMGIGMDLLGQRQSGDEFPVEISLSPLAAEQGTLVAAAVRDITARKRVEEKLRQSERLAAIGEMITGLAHESRNALQRSMACLEMLGLEMQERPRALDLLGRVKKAQDHLQYLYEEVRQYARPIHLKREPCNLAQLVQETWNDLVEADPAKGVALSAPAEHVELTCFVDRFAIGQVFRNILENAHAASPQGGRIDIKWTETVLTGQRAVRAVIRDNGPGLAAEQRARIFEPFFTTKTKGTGLGMAIAKRLVEAHGGQVAVGDGQTSGAEILVILPRGTP